MGDVDFGVERSDRSDAAIAYAANKAALQKEIMDRVQGLIVPDQASSPIDHAVIASAQGILANFCNEVESPSVIRIGPNIDPWEERLKHVRELASFVPESLMETGAREAGLEADDPRREKLKIIVDRIGALVTETLEEAISAVDAEPTLAATAPSGPKM
jgi:hypothetical protein